ncbi:hypothetical protein D9757_010152 [Collybiopsis confluens]|uniref:Uncharacterized protein n=1 Tax=Collybiopsis confluens TaxID=2823264 RepID=A0A8H5LYZ9_9AGAR|nr:hypothetical protein D9757_010152 [Collybiopsis confluens]
MNSRPYLPQTKKHSGMASVVLVPSTSTDMRDCHESQPLQWHVQYYAETLEPSSSVSLFAQTTQEEDEIFYATFPQARGRYWTPQSISNNQYFGETAFCLSPRYSFHHPGGSNAPLSFVGTSKLAQGEPVFPVYSATTISVQSASRVSSSSELMAAINLCGGESAAQIDSDPLQLNQTSTTGPKLEPIDYPLPAMTYPVNQEKAYVSSDEPLMDFLAPPCSVSVKAEVSSPQDQQLSVNGFSSPLAIQPVSPLFRNELTTRARSSIIDSSPDVAKVESSPTSESASPSPLPLPSLTIAMPSPRAQESPGTRSDNPSELTGLMRLSPLPINRRPAEKKKAQTLACNFCRVRKIACGPPLAGTVEKTCK